MIKLLKWEQSKTSIRLTFNIVGIDKIDKNDITLQVSKKNLKLNLKEKFLEENGLEKKPPFEVQEFSYYIDAKKTICQRKGDYLVVTQKKKDDNVKWACLEKRSDDKENIENCASEVETNTIPENIKPDNKVVLKEKRPQLKVLRQNNLNQNSEQTGQLFDIHNENQDREFEKNEMVGFHQPSPKSCNNIEKRPFREIDNIAQAPHSKNDINSNSDKDCEKNLSETGDNKQNFFSLNFGQKYEETYYNELKRKQFEKNRNAEPEHPIEKDEQLSNNSQNLVDELLQDSVERTVKNINGSQVYFFFIHD